MLQVKPAKDEVPVLRIDRSAETYEYLFRTDCAQGKTIGRMLFRGYTKRPPSMKENGYGFSRHLKPFLCTTEAGHSLGQWGWGRAEMLLRHL